MRKYITKALTILAISFLLPAFSYSAEFVTDGLLSFWSLDKSTISGTTVKDLVGKTDGTIVGEPKSVPGKIKECLKFSGSQDRVEVPKALMVGLESFTIECWFNYENSANWRWMFGGGPEWNYGLGFCIHSGSNIVRYHLKTDKGSFYTGNGSTSLNPGDWYHIAYTYNGKSAISYVNSKKDFEQAITGIVLIDPTTLAIGAGYWNNNEYFVGMIDEVRVYERALSEEEVNKNYRAKSNSLAVSPLGKLPDLWGNIKR